MLYTSLTHTRITLNKNEHPSSTVQLSWMRQRPFCATLNLKRHLSEASWQAEVNLAFVFLTSLIHHVYTPHFHVHPIFLFFIHHQSS